ncbi:hypothetical protein BGZ63DRAFT_400187 [Mariannaea sp. PMI_226]|nr:hypothetical protein BGZ63DRAFT_400187 [Mariannaea sp. PMI_226]
MGQKRDFGEMGSPEPGSPERHTSNGFKKQKRTGKAKNRPNEGSSQWARKRVRNIERLLNRNADLPANVRNDLERELAAHQTSVDDRAFQRKRSAMITKYHMVRFFERKRSMRLAKQLRKRLQQCESPEEKKEIERHIHIVEVDEAYTHNFPHAEPYISLYKIESTKDGDEEDKAAKATALLEADRPPMWATIEKAMEGGPSALRAIRERRTADDSKETSRPERRQQKPKATQTQVKPVAKTPPKPQMKETVASQNKNGTTAVAMNRRERRRLMREAAPAKDEDDESDGGGFFEEG